MSRRVLLNFGLLLVLFLIQVFASVDEIHPVSETANSLVSSTVEPKNSSLAVWGACFGAVLVVSASGLVVVALVPLMSRNFYNFMTQYLIALSVGSLTGDAFLHLIPHALTSDHGHSHEHDVTVPHGNQDDVSDHRRDVAKGLVVLLGLLAFFITERVTILWQNKNSRKKMKRKFHHNTQLIPQSMAKPNIEDGLMDVTEEKGIFSSIECQFEDCTEHGLVSHQQHQSDSRLTSTGTSMSRKQAPLFHHNHHHSHAHHFFTSNQSNVHQQKARRWRFRRSASAQSDASSSDSSYTSHEHDLAVEGLVSNAVSGPSPECRQSSAKGMRSHVGGVDTAPPNELIIHCHHHHHQHHAGAHDTQLCRNNRKSAEDLSGLAAADKSSTLWQKIRSGASRLSPHHHKHSHENDGSSKLMMVNHPPPVTMINHITLKKKDESSASLQMYDNDKPECRSAHSTSALHRDCCLTNKDARHSCSSCSLNDGQQSGHPDQQADASEQGLEVKVLGKIDRDPLVQQHNKVTQHHSHCYGGNPFVSPLRDKPHGHHHGHSHDLSNVRAMAYTIIAGDGLHNFCDGIAIGAAFASSTNLAGGVSTFIAVLCHELPHELGDFAVLLNAGMSVKTALFYNFLTVLFCFLGMVLGVFLGSLHWVSSWLFMLTAGMFIYIALVDMVPELATQRLKGIRRLHSPLVLFLCQNAGIVTGFVLMFLIAWFEPR